jgi:hypothetical protein
MEGIASLLEAERPRLAALLGTKPFGIEAVDGGHCRVTSDLFTLHFYARQGEGPVDSSIELASVPAHAVPFASHLHTWLVLKSHGEDWPALRPEAPPSARLAEELDRVELALPLVRDRIALQETLLWEAGYMNGHAQWA